MNCNGLYMDTWKNHEFCVSWDTRAGIDTAVCVLHGAVFELPEIEEVLDL